MKMVGIQNIRKIYEQIFILVLLCAGVILSAEADWDKAAELCKAEALYRDLSAKEDIYSENLLKRINRHKAGGGAK